MCKAHEYDAKTSETANIIRVHCSPESTTQKYQISSVHAKCTPINWSKDSQRYNIYTNEKVMYDLLFSSQQPKAKDFRRHSCNVLFPHVWRQLKKKMKEDHQQAIEEKIKFKPCSIEMLHYKYKKMCIRQSYKNVKIPSHILRDVMFLIREILAKTILSLLYKNIQ